MKSRLDKWLWSVRIFKSRTQATDACKSGKVKINEKVVKASHDLSLGDVILVKKRGINFTYKVEKIIQKRVSALIAQPCYQDLTPIEEINKFNSWFVGKSQAEKRPQGIGRPTKKERRVIDGFKSDFLLQEE